MRYITPEHCIKNRLGERPAPSWPAALLVFRDHPNSQKVLQALDNVRPVQYRMLYNLTDPEFEPFVFEADIGGHTIVIVTRCVWGGPQAAILVEELACLGVNFILGYSVAGSLVPDLPQGAFFVARSALPTDGTSNAYGAESALDADDRLVQLAIASAADAGREMKPVTAVTVDALYRETDELVANLRCQGGQIVNLEVSALYAAAAACDVRSLQVGYVTDCLADGVWHDWYADLGGAADAAVLTCRNLLAAILGCRQDRS